jgi:hypothetical protein
MVFHKHDQYFVTQVTFICDTRFAHKEGKI